MSKFFDMAEIRGKSSDGDPSCRRGCFPPRPAQWNRAAEAVHGKRYAVITVPALPLTASFALPREVISTFPVPTFSR